MLTGESYLEFHFMSTWKAICAIGRGSPCAALYAIGIIQRSQVARRTGRIALPNNLAPCLGCAQWSILRKAVLAGSCDIAFV